MTRESRPTTGHRWSRRETCLRGQLKREARSEERRVGKEGRARGSRDQAEDGIRDYKVTGVQTCALPICQRRTILASGLSLAAGAALGLAYAGMLPPLSDRLYDAGIAAYNRAQMVQARDLFTRAIEAGSEIGRASGRERGESAGVEGSSRRRHTRLQGDWSSDVCSSDLPAADDSGVGAQSGRRRRSGVSLRRHAASAVRPAV